VTTRSLGSRSRLLVWSLVGFFLALSAAFVVLSRLNGEDIAENLLFSLLYATFAGVGALLASRKPENSLGWIFLWIGIGANLGNAASSYGVYALRTVPGALPGGEWAAWAGSFLWPTAIVSILLLLVLFPSGRPHARPERWLLRAAVVAIGGLSLGGFVLKPGRLDVAGLDIPNPLGVESLTAVLPVLELVGAVLIPVVALASVAMLVVRSRRAVGVVRQQLRWFGYSALAMFSINFVFANLLKTFVPSTRGWVGNLAFALGLAMIPLGTGVAILRYRLYELDLIVNRTLVYAVLTGVLASAYLAIVVVLQSFSPVGTDSDLAVAGSTLAVAALFRPLRARIQTFIDRRFYRRRYDAGETLAEFSTRLRDQVDLGALTTELVQVVRSTMQPSHASLWLRPDEGVARARVMRR
jgi:hypothetical protein